VQVGPDGGAATVTIDSSARLNIGSLVAGRFSGASDGVHINVNGGTLVVTNGDAEITGGATLNFSAGSISVSGKLVASGTGQVVLSAGGNKVLRAGGVGFSGSGKIDLNDNDMIVGSVTPKAFVQQSIASARNSGAWNGAIGITSTAAKNRLPKNTTLGILSGAEFTSVGGGSTFSGQPYSATDTLVKYTYYGDTDFNGVVNFDDYSRTDSGFNLHKSGWLNGDFDYNNVVDFDDYSLIDLAFNTQSGTLRRAMSYLEGGDRNTNDMNGPELRMVVDHFNQFGLGYAQSFLAAVPEPASALFAAAIGGASLLRRRRRR
jgi:hypothetical protein